MILRAGFVALWILYLVLAVTTIARGASSLTTTQQRTRAAILDVWPRPLAGDALDVFWCESRWFPTAENGQYKGIAQMGSWERRTYGHGRTARAQAQAALRYFRATGSDWSPWSCRPY